MFNFCLALAFSGHWIATSRYWWKGTVIQIICLMAIFWSKSLNFIACFACRLPLSWYSWNGFNLVSSLWKKLTPSFLVWKDRKFVPRNQSVCFGAFLSEVADLWFSLLYRLIRYMISICKSSSLWKPIKKVRSYRKLFRTLYILRSYNGEFKNFFRILLQCVMSRAPENLPIFEMPS